MRAIVAILSLLSVIYSVSTYGGQTAKLSYSQQGLLEAPIINLSRCLAYSNCEPTPIGKVVSREDAGEKIICMEIGMIYRSLPQNQRGLVQHSMEFCDSAYTQVSAKAALGELCDLLTVPGWRSQLIRKHYCSTQ